jgi:hypothetical protein
MDKENVVHIYNGVLLSHKDKWNYVVLGKMNNIKWNKPSSEREILHIFFHIHFIHTYECKCGTDWGQAGAGKGKENHRERE